MAFYRRRLPTDPPKGKGDPTGPWEVAVRDASGKQHVRRVDPRTGDHIRGKRHAKDVETWLVNELLAPAPADHPSVTLREFSRRWWTGHVRHKVDSDSWDNYKMQLEQRILTTHVPYAGSSDVPLGDVPLGEIRVSMIDEWMANLAAAGDNPPTINRARAILSSILGKAVKWEVIPANPCASTDRIQEIKLARRYLTTREVMRIADEARNLRDRTMIIVGYVTGLRPSELLGLTVENVHLDADVPYVYVAWQLAEPRVKDREVVKPARLKRPKDHETGSIELPALAVDTLREYLAAPDPHPPIATPDGDVLHLAFAQASGKPLVLHTWRRSSFEPPAIRAGLGQPVLDAAGRPVMTKEVPKKRKPRPVVRCLVSPNDLRHGFASLLRSLDPPASPEYLCARMRHSDPAFTMRTYGDLFAAPAAPVIAAMDAALATGA